MRPFLFENRDKNKVELVEKGAVSLERFLRCRALQDILDDEIAYACYPSASCMRPSKGHQDLPWHCSRGRTFHLVIITLSRTCKPKTRICQHPCAVHSITSQSAIEDKHLVCS